MSLAAMAEGLGTCWIGAFHEDQVKRILGIPENIRVVAMLALGYPGKANASRLRKELQEIVAYDGWRSWPPWGSRFFLRRLGLISERDDVQKFFGKKTKKRLL